MPEGDTIHTVARALGPMLVGVVGLEVAGAEVGAVMRARDQGPLGRRSFWCPACQAG